MIMQGSRFWMGVGRFSRLQRGVQVLLMLAGVLDTMQCVESVCDVPLGAGVL